ncbi:MAG TPA: hypothetical protein VKA08_14365 [Balneolales bacterium]|nr:hypothetical protein [Balneolales bacterium]
MLLRYQISLNRKSLLLIIFCGISFTACSENIGLANLNRDLYAKYPARFLHASLHENSLRILMYRNSDSLARSLWKQNALDVSRFILSKKDDDLHFKTLDFRYQNISAQVVIADSNAVTFHFNADSLQNLWAKQKN